MKKFENDYYFNIWFASYCEDYCKTLVFNLLLSDIFCLLRTPDFPIKIITTHNVIMHVDMSPSRQSQTNSIGFQSRRIGHCIGIAVGTLKIMSLCLDADLSNATIAANHSRGTALPSKPSDGSGKRCICHWESFADSSVRVTLCFWV